MADDPQVLSQRLARFVAPVPAKHLSRLIGCDVRTAENMKRGHWPIARHWAGLIRAFGEDVTEAVFHYTKRPSGWNGRSMILNSNWPANVRRWLRGLALSVRKLVLRLRLGPAA